MDNATVNVGQSIVAPLMLVGQSLVVDAKLMHDCCLEVMHVNRVFNDIDTVVVRSSVAESRFDSASSQPVGKTVGMMVTSIVIWCELALAVDGAPKFTSPDDEGFV